MDFRRDVRDRSCHTGSLGAEAEATERCSHNRSRQRERGVASAWHATL